HVGYVCDASFPTVIMTHWGRDRTRGERFDLAWLVHGQTLKNATALGLHDRGQLAPGLRADINVIDIERLRLGFPEFLNDLPGGATRVVQRADGYSHTFVAGQEVYANGEHTGALPGRLVRGSRSA